MSEHNIPAAEYGAMADAELGPIVLRGRPLQTMRCQAAAMGCGILRAYVILGLSPILVATVVGGLVLVLIYMIWIQYHPDPVDMAQEVKAAVFAFCFVPVYVAMIWLGYFQPRGDHLVLHEEGFRLKIGFKGRRVLFRELRAITLGLDFDAVMSDLAQTRPGHPAALRKLTSEEDLAGPEMNLHYLDGSKTVINGFLYRFEPEDLRAFLDFLAERHPRLRPTLDSD